MIFVIIMSLTQIEYFGAYYLATVIDGNFFINLIVMGAGEAFCCTWSGYLLTKMKDTHVFLIANLMNGIFITLFYVVPAGLP